MNKFHRGRVEWINHIWNNNDKNKQFDILKEDKENK
jgi:hypothetical protein